MKLRNKKTGRIFAVGDDIFICNDILGKIKLYWRTNGEDVIAFYDDLFQFNEDWEDYKPVEPLIKDEKIRKAVRAWAEASDVGVARVAPFAVFDIETSARIFFYSRVIEDKDYDEEKTYTIAELCGGEE